MSQPRSPVQPESHWQVPTHDPYAIRLPTFVPCSIVGVLLLWIVSPIVFFMEVFGDCIGEHCDAAYAAAAMRVGSLLALLTVTSFITGLTLARGRRMLPALVACCAGIIMVLGVAANVACSKGAMAPSCQG